MSYYFLATAYNTMLTIEKKPTRANLRQEKLGIFGADGGDELSRPVNLNRLQSADKFLSQPRKRFVHAVNDADRCFSRW